MVDGIERGTLNPAERSSISFSVEEDAEIIEVKTTDPRGDLLLATHLLTSLTKDAHDAAIVSSIRLEGGQELSLSITRTPIDVNDGSDLSGHVRLSGDKPAESCAFVVATAPASPQSGATPWQCVGWLKNTSAAHPRRSAWQLFA